MKFPLTLTFKIVALAPQIYVKDADGNDVCYVRQRLLKLKESVHVFKDRSREEPLCDIKADRIIDFSPVFTFTDPKGRDFGKVRRYGVRSLWKAHYEILGSNGEDLLMEIHEESPFIKVMDGIFGEIPLVGALGGYFFNPSYLISRPNREPVMRVRKRPAFWEGVFTIDALKETEPVEQLRAVLSVTTMVLLERGRG